MDVKDAYTAEIVFIEEYMPIREAVRLLRQSRLAALPVVHEDGKLAGMFTRSNAYDVILQGIDIDSPVKAVMIQEPLICHIDNKFEEIDVSTGSFGQSIVVDDNNFPVGIISKTTIVLAMCHKLDMLASYLGTMLEEMEHGIVAVDKAGVITVFNRMAAELTGLEPSKVVGQRVGEVLPELGIERVFHKRSSIEMHKHKMGERSFLANIRIIKGQAGLVGAMALLHDLTQIEMMTGEIESVRKLNNTMDAILETAYDGIIVVNEEGFVTVANKSMCDFLGRPAGEIVNCHITEVMENTRLHLVAETGVAEYSDVQTIRGTRYAVSSVPIIQDGKSVGAVGKVIFRHLGELKNLVKKMELLEKQLDKYREEAGFLKGARYTFEHIISVNSEVEKAKKEAKRAAIGSLPVLLLGPSGTGKELFAHAIHNAGSRRGAPFVKVNCAAIPVELLESEFFGYESGAFTGARSQGKPGKFELADGGTLFLDEIGDMALNLQSKLLRVLQDGEFEKVGGTRLIQVNVRIIAATNQDLGALIVAGRFRADLYYRLNVLAINIPPLAHRPEDIPYLISNFINKFNVEIGTKVTGISNEALQALMNYDYPGNIRELENIIRRAIYLAEGAGIDLMHLPRHISYRNPVLQAADVEPILIKPVEIKIEDPVMEKVPTPVADDIKSYGDAMADRERELIIKTLASTSGNRKMAAKLLNIGRATLYERMRRLGIPTNKKQQ